MSCGSRLTYIALPDVVRSLSDLAAHRKVFPPGYPSHHEDFDFRSPWLRLVIIATINVQWLIQEWYKFSTQGYPYSPLESWQSNAIVLAISSVAAFFGMKQLSFAPLLEKR